MQTAPLVTIRDFQMRFGEKTVIENLSFEVHSGEVFGFLGSNGSGKTTTIRALLGIYPPTHGELLIDGRRFSPSMNHLLGYLPEERGLYKKESVIDTMTYFGRLKNLSRNQARAWSLAYLERVGLGDKANERLDRLSGGQQQKVQLGVTIMNKPQLLILDEPTKGFDPVNRRLMMEIIEERRQEGATVVLVTHQMEEVERLCDRIVLLKDGTRRLYGAVDEIKRSYGSDHIAIRYTGTLKPDSKLYEMRKQTATSAMLAPKTGVGQREIFVSLGRQPGIEVSHFEVQRPSLDDIFVQIYRDNEEGDHHA